jgi:hypothetical protein
MRDLDVFAKLLALPRLWLIESVSGCFHEKGNRIVFERYLMWPSRCRRNLQNRRLNVCRAALDDVPNTISARGLTEQPTTDAGG